MPYSKVPYDRREFGRRRVVVAAQIRFADKTLLDCMVLNVSEGGALLEVDAAAVVPLRFLLCIEDGVVLACETRHRSGSRVGVEFTVAASVATVDPAAVSDLVAFAREAPWGRDTY